MNKTMYYLILSLLFCAGTSFKFSSSHDDMPIGCDEFGYLNLAKNIDESTVVERPYFDELVSTLRNNGIAEYEFSWLLTPHAYHVVPGTNLVINQYPPGTSWLLSFFPYQSRKLLFPLLVMMTLMLLPLLLSGSITNRKWTAFDLALPVFLFLATVSAPFTTEFARVNSLAVTFGLLLSAGMAVRTRPLLACFLIAITVNFRIINILMVIPVALFLPFNSFTDKEGIKQNALLILKFGALAVIALLPLLIYNYRLLGNPIAITYSSIDTAVNGSGNFIHNLKYYFDFDQRWLRVHLVIITGILILKFIAHIKCDNCIKILTFPIINYLFFGWHTVTMDYYPYASAILLTGILFSYLKEIKMSKFFRFITPVSGALIAIIVLISGINRYTKKEHLTFEQAEAIYAGLCRFDIVWSDLYSGTTEYVCRNNGFRFATGTPRAREIVLQYLHEKRMDQVIILEDVPMDAQKIKQELQHAELSFSVSVDRNLGPLVLIPGSKTIKAPKK